MRAATTHADLAGASTKPPAYEPVQGAEQLNLPKAVKFVLAVAETLHSDLHAVTTIAEVGAEGHDDRTAAKVYAALTARMAALRVRGVDSDTSDAGRLAGPVLDALRDRMTAPDIRPYYLTQLSVATGRATMRAATTAREEEEE